MCRPPAGWRHRGCAAAAGYLLAMLLLAATLPCCASLAPVHPVPSELEPWQGGRRAAEEQTGRNIARRALTQEQGQQQQGGDAGGSASLDSRCPAGCTRYATCNEELGRCDCPLDRDGAACELLLAGPALEKRSREMWFDSVEHLPRAPCLNSCLGRGACHYGTCVCLPGYFGYDCSLSIDADTGRPALLMPPGARRVGMTAPPPLELEGKVKPPAAPPTAAPTAAPLPSDNADPASASDAAAGGSAAAGGVLARNLLAAARAALRHLLSPHASMPPTTPTLDEHEHGSSSAVDASTGWDSREASAAAAWSAVLREHEAAVGREVWRHRSYYTRSEADDDGSGTDYGGMSYRGVDTDAESGAYGSEQQGHSEGEEEDEEEEGGEGWGLQPASWLRRLLEGDGGDGGDDGRHALHGLLVPARGRGSSRWRGGDRRLSMLMDSAEGLQAYKPRNAGPKIYVYELPPNVTTWFNFWAIDRPTHWMLLQRLLATGIRTADGAEADYYYMPLCSRPLPDWLVPTMNWGLPYIRAAWPWWNATGGGWRHLQVHTGDMGGAELHNVEPKVIAQAENITWLHHWGLVKDRKDVADSWVKAHRPGHDLVIPVIMPLPPWHAHHFTPLHPLAPQLPRKKTMFFAGRICGDRSEPDPSDGACPAERLDYSAQTRSRVYAAHFKHPNFTMVTSTPKYLDGMAGARFCLAPTGGGHGKRNIMVSFYGCIPVTVTDHVLQPFEPEMDWSSFSVPLPEAHIPRLDRLLEALEADPARLAAMQEALRCAAQHLYYSSALGAVMGESGRYDAFETMMEILRMRRAHPGADPATYAALDPAFRDFMACNLTGYPLQPHPKYGISTILKKKNATAAGAQEQQQGQGGPGSTLDPASEDPDEIDRRKRARARLSSAASVCTRAHPMPETPTNPSPAPSCMVCRQLAGKAMGLYEAHASHWFGWAGGTMCCNGQLAHCPRFVQ